MNNSEPNSDTDKKKPLISVRNLHQHFGNKHVLRGVNLDIYHGETICLLGSSGGGKTVLVKHMLGLIQPTKGSVKIDGVEIAHLSERKIAPIRKKLGIMFQNGALFDSMNVAQNIAFPLVESGIKDNNILNNHVKKVLDIVKLPGQEKTMPSELSGGMKKRVALARAIVDKTECVCYDEPHAGLDPITASSIDRLIKCLQIEHGITNIVITHELRSVFRIADRVVFMKDGQVYWQGTPTDVKNTTNPIIQKFFEGTDSNVSNWYCKCQSQQLVK